MIRQALPASWGKRPPCSIRVARAASWQLVEEKGNHEDDLTVDSKRAVKDVLLPGDTNLPPMGMGDEEPSHMTNWLECLRSRK